MNVSVETVRYARRLKMEIDFVFMLFSRSADGSFALIGAVPNIDWWECFDYATRTNQLPHQKFGVCMPVIR